MNNYKYIVPIILIFFLTCVSGKNSNKKYVRFLYNDKIHFGEITKNNTIYELKENFLYSTNKTGKKYKLNNIKLLAPVKPSKIIAVGLNYRSHAGMSGASSPNLFSKLPSSLSGPGDPVFIYPDTITLHYEGELVIVIGKKGKNIPINKAEKYIFGITAGNDITDRGWQNRDLQWIRAKGADSFSPIGPWVVTNLNYNNLLVQTKVNGRIVQSERSKNLIHPIKKIISYASRYITLEPGDIIFTGTPGRTKSLKAGDKIEVFIEGVGTLKNIVRKK